MDGTLTFQTRDTIKTTCPYCGVGCGVLATPQADGSIAIAGDPQHPANRGRLCVKGAALGETLGLDGRLLHPLSRDRTQPARPESRLSWDAALDRVATTFSRTIAEHGPESVAFYVSGQLLTEDYYVANKLMKGYIGAANIDTNSRLCMASAVAGHVRAFGEDLVPVRYEDLEQADLVVLVGSNTAWCHPVLYQRLIAAKQQRPSLQIVVVDPRRTATCESADLHLPIKPGSDVWLFNGLLAYLHKNGLTDVAFVRDHTQGADAAIAAAESSTGSLAHVARACGVSEDLLRRFYALFAGTKRVVTAFSMGVNQSSSGTDKVNAIINCHLLTGRIHRPGAGPFSLTGQPNAMGGREVGGLANQLAAHLRLEEPAHRALVQSFWNSPRIAQRPGYKAVELFEAVADGRIKALWIMATNPLVSLPNADRVRAALDACPFVVVSDVVGDTDTAHCADLLLPATAWGERDGSVTNSESCISRQRRFLPTPGEARPDWWIISAVARRMGFADAFNYTGPQEIFVEHAGLSSYGNDAGAAEPAVPRRFNIGALAALSDVDYDALPPTRWPELAAAQSPVANRQSRCNLIPLRPRAPANAPDDDYPLTLSTGRLRDHWHTMTRTGRAPRLATHATESALAIHPHDALAWGLRDGHLTRVTSRWGSAVLRVTASASVARRQLFAPIHWSGANASDARIGALVNPVVDPLSGEPEFKHTPARVEPFFVDWYGFALLRRPPRTDADGLAWWTRIQGAAHLRYELAGRGQLEWSSWAQALLGVHRDADWLEIHDASDGLYRALSLIDGRLDAALFIAARPEDLPPREWLGAQFAADAATDTGDIDRLALLAGRPARCKGDPGTTICACHGVGRNTILQAVNDGCTSIEALGARLRCGTGCGSCIPELRALLAEADIRRDNLTPA